MFTCTHKPCIFFVLFCFSLLTSAQAQDSIRLLDGEVIEASIKSLTGKYIEFTTTDLQDGEISRIAKTKVDMVKKKNGTTVFFNRLPKESVESKIQKTSLPIVKKEQKKAPIAIQKLNRRQMEVLYPINFHIFGGIVLPEAAVSSFDMGYTLGIEYTNYYSNNLGFIGHVSGTYNQINYNEKKGSLYGELVNTWLMVGAKVGTGTLISPLRIYGQATIGGNYMLPMNGLDQVGNSVNFAYSGGAGVVVKDLVHLGLRYHHTRQKTSTSNRTEMLDGAYLSVILGVQF